MEKYKEKCEQLVRITANNALQYTQDLHALNSFARFSGRPLRISEKLAMTYAPILGPRHSCVLIDRRCAHASVTKLVARARKVLKRSKNFRLYCGFTNSHDCDACRSIRTCSFAVPCKAKCWQVVEPHLIRMRWFVCLACQQTEIDSWLRELELVTRLFDASKKDQDIMTQNLENCRV